MPKIFLALGALKVFFILVSNVGLESEILRPIWDAKLVLCILGDWVSVSYFVLEIAEGRYPDLSEILVEVLNLSITPRSAEG